jgi:hypothetical protein
VSASCCAALGDGAVALSVFVTSLPVVFVTPSTVDDDDDDVVVVVVVVIDVGFVVVDP